MASLTRRSVLRSLTGSTASALLPSARSQDNPSTLRIGGGTIEVRFQSDQFDLPRKAILDWVSTGARAVSAYFGRFPVAHARLEIVMAAGRRGGRINGVTFGDGGARSRLTVAQHVTAEELSRDWVLTHEMVHYGFPSMDRAHHWIEEGSATYVEPIARAEVGNLSVAQVWGDMVRDMPQGLPADGDQGLDRTHTWARTYWGGALYCLLADVRIRRQTHGRRGLVDALRGIIRAGGNIEKDWPLERALEIGDKATGTTVMMSLYGEMAAKPMPVDLPDLWKQLGVRRDGGQVTFDDGAPLAKVRAAISS
ncbi:MAG TPA: hypothetical protein VMB03_33455 [Bryobacteraceae bacterium]|nr:hypothetical protein [Bryobacteraceae bacterium]